MSHRRSIIVVLAALFGGCQKSEPPVSDLPAPAIAPAPPKQPVSFLELVSTVPADAGPVIDASALGASVDAYLIERGGLSMDEDADHFNLELVVSSAAGCRVVSIGSFDYEDEVAPDLGYVRATPAYFPPRPFQPDYVSEGWPPFRNRAPVVFTWSTRTLQGVEERFVITLEYDTLVVWSAAKTWTRFRTVQLAAGATVAAPIVDVAVTEPVHDRRAPLEVREHLAMAGRDNLRASFDLVVGKIRGSLATCSVARRVQPFFAGERAWTAAPLPDPAPITGLVLATRSCLDASGQIETFTLERRGELIYFWRRFDGKKPSPWTEYMVFLSS